MKTKVVNMIEANAEEDFRDNIDYVDLFRYEMLGYDVEVRGESTDGGYYDVVLLDGTVIPHVSWYHLEHFENKTFNRPTRG